MSTTFRKTSAVVWTQDPSPIAVRKTHALAFASDVGLTLRNIQGFAFETVPPGMTLRNIQGFAFERAPLAIPVNVTGDLALYTLINNNRKPGVSITWSASNSALGTPVADNTYGTTNTRISLSAKSNSGYNGSVNLFYTRRSITDAVLGSVSLGTISSATTVVSMLPTINSKYGLNLTAQDVVDGPVAAGATFITLTIASSSWVFLPGSVVAVGIVTSLASATPVVDLLGFDNAAGVGPSPFTKALLHFDGNFSDASGRIWTAAAEATTESSTVKFGSGAFQNTGVVGKYISTPDANDLHLTGDFTVEGFINPNNITQSQVLIIKGSASPNTGARLILSSGQIFAYDDAVSNQMSGGSISTGSWYHVALVKYNGTATIYVGGSPVASSTSFGTFGNNNYPLYVGTASDGSFPMYTTMDELRISAEARYKSSFTPPTSSFVFD